MISESYKAMLSGKSVIRELSEYATARGKEIGYENVFDYSLGNPSVPAPRAYNDKLIELISTGNPMLVHGYSPSLGIPSVREKIAQSLNRRLSLNYKGEDIFMASGAAGALLAYHPYVCAHDHVEMSPEEYKKGRRALWFMDAHTLICAFQLSNFRLQLLFCFFQSQFHTIAERRFALWNVFPVGFFCVICVWYF